MTAKPNILHNPWNYPYSEWGVNEQTYSTAVPSEEAFPYEDFVGNSRMGADLWAKNPALRQVPKNNRYTYIGAIERGEKNWSVGTLSRIAEGLDVGINELFDLAPSQTPDKSTVMIMKELQKCRPEFLQLFLDLIKGINALQNRKTAKGD